MINSNRRAWVHYTGGIIKPAPPMYMLASVLTYSFCAWLRSSPKENFVRHTHVMLRTIAVPSAPTYFRKNTGIPSNSHCIVLHYCSKQGLRLPSRLRRTLLMLTGLLHQRRQNFIPDQHERSRITSFGLRADPDAQTSSSCRGARIKTPWAFYLQTTHCGSFLGNFRTRSGSNVCGTPNFTFSST